MPEATRGPAYLMSYPARNWGRGWAGVNFRSREAVTEAKHPRQAMREWIALADAIEQHGGRVYVVPPPKYDPPLNGMPFAANFGIWSRSASKPTYVLARPSVLHRQGEPRLLQLFWKSFDVELAQPVSAWEGQADVQELPANRFLVSWGPRSSKASVMEVIPHLPSGAVPFEVEIVKDPSGRYFHGDTVFSVVANPNGETYFLAYRDAVRSPAFGSLAEFVTGTGVREVIELSLEDTLAYAANGLEVNGTLIMPDGISSSLKGVLESRGFPVTVLPFHELFGKGGGGPRCQVNVLREIPSQVEEQLAPVAFSASRSKLVRVAHKYPNEI